MAYKKLYVDGVDLFTTYGVYTSGQGVFASPERDYVFYDVKGRNGDLVSLKTKLKNMTVSYKCGIVSSFDANLADLRAFLLTRIGYVKIKDDYHPTEFRLGVFTGPLEPSVNETNDAGEFLLTFNCRPQRFLDSGDPYTVITSSPTPIVNPTAFDATPFLRINGYGWVRFGVIGGRVWTLNIDQAHPGTYIDIDCETMQAYNGSGNMLPYVSCSSGDVRNVADFPVLTAEKQTDISFPTTITAVRVRPRWWSV